MCIGKKNAAWPGRNMVLWYIEVENLRTIHIQRNLSKPNLLGIYFCVRNRQVFGLYKLN
jgi:hypothetical protein